MSIGHDIHAAEGGLRSLLWAAHIQAQAARRERQAQAQDNAVASVDRLGQALLAARRREAALTREIAALRRAQAAPARQMDWGMDWGTGYSRA